MNGDCEIRLLTLKSKIQLSYLYWCENIVTLLHATMYFVWHLLGDKPYNIFPHF